MAKKVNDSGWAQTIKNVESFIVSPNKITIKNSAGFEIEAPFLSNDVKGTLIYYRIIGWYNSHVILINWCCRIS